MDRTTRETFARIKNPKAYMTSKWDIELFDDCFGNTKICMSDIDGVVEKNGAVLFVEFKYAGSVTDRGQQLLFEKLSEKQNCFVMQIEGKPPRNPTAYRIWSSGKVGKWTECNVDGVKERVKRWFDWACRLREEEFQEEKPSKDYYCTF